MIDSSGSRFRKMFRDYLDMVSVIEQNGTPLDPKTGLPTIPPPRNIDPKMRTALAKAFNGAFELVEQAREEGYSREQLAAITNSACDEWERKLETIKKAFIPVPPTESPLFLNKSYTPVGTPAVTDSTMDALLRKDKWQEENGIGFFERIGKSNSKNYIKHYISVDDDLTFVPRHEALQIIEKFGYTAAKLHLIFAAHTMRQEKPWESRFYLKGSDLVKEMGWDKSHNNSQLEKLREIASTGWALDHLRVEAVWELGKNKKGETYISCPVGRVWNVTVDPRGLLRNPATPDESTEVYLDVQPGPWTQHFLNQAGYYSKEALFQFGYLAEQCLKINAHLDRLALVLALRLTTESRYHQSGKYQVRTLLEKAYSIPQIEEARVDFRYRAKLKKQWDDALTTLIKLGWQVEYDDETYPEWLRPQSGITLPTGYMERLLQALIYLRQPSPIPQLLANIFRQAPEFRTLLLSDKPTTDKPARKPARKPAGRPAKQKKSGLTGDDIRSARKRKGWSQHKLAGTLGVTQTLVSYWEREDRVPTPTQEKHIRRILEL